MYQQAVRDLRRGAYAAVQEQVKRLLTLKLDPGLLSATHDLSAEAHFRAALASDDMTERLQHLDAALQLKPAIPKLHFYRGIMLWQQGRRTEGLAELDVTATHEPNRRGLAYLRALARAASGQPWDATGLTPAEANTVRLVGQFTQHKLQAGATMPAGPLLGKGTDLWQALIAMREDATAAPLSQLKTAAEQNSRKPISRIVNYYKGVAFLRANDRGAARAAWLSAQNAGLNSTVLAENLIALLREELVGLSQEGRWQETVHLVSRLPDPGADRILAETASLAYYHLGYEAAQAGKWSVAAQHWRAAVELDANRYLAQNLALAEEALGNWGNAAEAWREMVRRRPRKEDHPDYLTDAQVAALWNHAAECYSHTGQDHEVIACYRNAVKYAPDDTALRLRLADALLAQERDDAAETQLKEIAELEPGNTEALVRLGRLYGDRWDRDAMAIWRQVLAVNPSHPEAREALADSYFRLVSDRSPFANCRLSFMHPGKSEIEVLEIGLQELPGHPKVLAVLGIAHAHAEHLHQARDYLLQAHQAAPQDVRIANMVLHELLHTDAGDAVEKLIPAVRQIPRLLPAFWFDQAGMALQCKLGEEWADLFFEEAVKLGSEPWVDDTRGGLLLEAYEIAFQNNATELRALLEQRIRQEVPTSGAVQYLEAHHLHFVKNDLRGAERLLHEAIRAARRANDRGVLRRAEANEMLFKGFPTGPDLDRILRDIFPLDL